MTTHPVDQVRSAIVTGHLRYVLGISLAAAVIALIAVSLFVI